MHNANRLTFTLSYCTLNITSDRERILAVRETASRSLNGANLLEVIALRILLTMTLCAAVFGVPAYNKNSNFIETKTRFFFLAAGGDWRREQRASEVMTHFTVNLPLENSLRFWKPSHSHLVNGCSSFDSRIDFTCIPLTGKRMLNV